MNNLQKQTSVKLSTPRLEIYPNRITQNAKTVIKQCQEKGVQVACVTKVTSAHQAVAKALAEANPDMLADSRLENLRKLRN